MSRNRVIGRNNSLPWHIPDDLRRFKILTEGNIVIMGGNTYRSLGCNPLPNRTNWVLSNSKFKKRPNTKIFTDYHSIKDLALYNFNKEIYIIGGALIYALFEDITTRIDLTTIDEDYSGDTFFPIDLTSYVLQDSVLIEDDMDRRILTYDKKTISRHGNPKFYQPN